MKKLLFVLPLTLLMFSCIDEFHEEYPTDDAPMRHLQRLDCTITEAGYVFYESYTYVWDGDNIIRIVRHTDDGEPDWQFDYQYEDGRIVSSIATYCGTQIPWSTYHYDGDKIDYMDFDGTRLYYTYDGDNISMIVYTYEDRSDTTLFTWNDGNCTQTYFQSYLEPEWINYVYDNKRNPFNFPMGVGVQEMIDDDWIGQLWNKNNYTYASESNGDTYTATYTYEGNYPTSRIVSSEDYSEEYIYTYSD